MVLAFVEELTDITQFRFVHIVQELCVPFDRTTLGIEVVGKTLDLFLVIRVCPDLKEQTLQRPYPFVPMVPFSTPFSTRICVIFVIEEPQVLGIAIIMIRLRPESID